MLPAWCPLACRAAGKLTLADRGKSAYRIVVPADAVPEQFAANELQHYVEAISGVKLPIVDDATPRQAHEIVLGASIGASPGWE